MGDLRFKAPQPAEKWNASLDVSASKPKACPQIPDEHLGDFVLVKFFVSTTYISIYTSVKVGFTVCPYHLELFRLLLLLCSKTNIQSRKFVFEPQSHHLSRSIKSQVGCAPNTRESLEQFYYFVITVVDPGGKRVL